MIYVESKEMIQINLFTKQKQTRREGIVRDFEINMYTLVYFRWIINRVQLYIAQGTMLNVMWQPGWEGSLGENGNMYMYMYTYVYM